MGHPDDGNGPAGAVHVPVALPRVVELLAPALADRPAVLVDATLGLGGHAAALLAAHPQLTLVGLDRDPEALALAAAAAGRARRPHRTWCTRSTTGSPRCSPSSGTPGSTPCCSTSGCPRCSWTPQTRGFSYARDADLDMRMDPTTGPTAADVLNTYPVPQLARVLREYGEERFAGRIAAAVDRRRRQAPLRRSAELVELLYAAVPAASRRTGGHPAKRTFQALRIEVNGELDALEHAIPAAIDALAVGGRIVVLAYHSLEDRIVKRELARRARSSTPLGLPVELPDHGPELRLLVRGAEQASPDEITENPRAASVRLRAAVRVREVAA